MDLGVDSSLQCSLDLSFVFIVYPVRLSWVMVMAIRGVLDAHPNAQAREKLKDSEKLVHICTFRTSENVTPRDDANLSPVVAVKLRSLAIYSGISIHRVGTLAMRPQCGHAH